VNEVEIEPVAWKIEGKDEVTDSEGEQQPILRLTTTPIHLREIGEALTLCGEHVPEPSRHVEPFFATGPCEKCEETL
jgi:hypothetical protein